MSEQTGNVWVDPDSGTPANPHNVIQSEFSGQPHVPHYGPGVVGDNAPTVATPVQPRQPKVTPPKRMPPKRTGEAVAGVDTLPELTKPTMGAGVTGVPVADDGAMALVTQAKDLYRQSTKAKTPAAQQAAHAALQALAAQEYAREGGARSSVVHVLRRYGFGKS